MEITIENNKAFLSEQIHLCQLMYKFPTKVLRISWIVSIENKLRKDQETIKNYVCDKYSELWMWKVHCFIFILNSL